jgi:hypothetical protein
VYHTVPHTCLSAMTLNFRWAPFYGALLVSLVPSILLTCIFLPQSSGAPTHGPSLVNITISVPNGTNDHGDQHLLCRPSHWTDVGTFFLGNYVAHAATVKTRPGESFSSVLITIALALAVPASSVVRALDAILNYAISGKTPLETASKAEALCVVIRAPDWKPRDGDKVRGVIFTRSLLRPYVRSETYIRSHDKNFHLVTVEQESLGAELPIPKVGTGNVQSIENNQQKISADSIAHTAKIEDQRLNVVGLELGIESLPFGLPFKPSRHRTTIQNRSVHGVCLLPPGYCLSILPPGTEVVGTHGPNEGLSRRPQWRWWAGHGKPEGKLELDNPDEISSSYSFSTGVVAILQTLYATFTLYQTRGNQVKRYGYAAFGLTVTPYLVMSLVNLISTILTPRYAAVYLIKSEVMAEAEGREGARFEGVVGSLKNKPSDSNESEVVFKVEADGRTIMYESEACHDRSEHMQAENNNGIGAIEVDVNSNGPQDSQGRKSENNQPIRVPSGALKFRPKKTLLSLFGAYLLGSVSVAMIAIISHFKAGQSTTSQRAWTMAWLGSGICIGSIFGTGRATQPPNPDDSGAAERWRTFISVVFISVVLCSIPAIGGFVVVAQMLQEYGNCIQIY